MDLQNSTIFHCLIEFLHDRLQPKMWVRAAHDMYKDSCDLPEEGKSPGRLNENKIEPLVRFRSGHMRGQILRLGWISVEYPSLGYFGSPWYFWIFVRVGNPRRPAVDESCLLEPMGVISFHPHRSYLLDHNKGSDEMQIFHASENE